MKILICATAYNGNPSMRYCVHGKSLYAILRTMEILGSIGRPLLRTKEILIFHTLTNFLLNLFKNPISVQTWKSLDPLLRTLEIPICVIAYNGHLYTRYCVQWKALYPSLRTIEIPVCVTTYTGNPYVRSCVQGQSLSALLRTMESPISVLRTTIMRITICVTAYNLMEISRSVTAYNRNPYTRYCLQ